MNPLLAMYRCRHCTVQVMTLSDRVGYQISSKFRGGLWQTLRALRAWGQTLDVIESSCIRPVHGIETPVNLLSACAGISDPRERVSLQSCRSKCWVRPTATLGHFSYQRFVMINRACSPMRALNTVTSATRRDCHLTVLCSVVASIEIHCSRDWTRPVFAAALVVPLRQGEEAKKMAYSVRVNSYEISRKISLFDRVFDLGLCLASGTVASTSCTFSFSLTH